MTNWLGLRVLGRGGKGSNLRDPQAKTGLTPLPHFPNCGAPSIARPKPWDDPRSQPSGLQTPIPVWRRRHQAEHLFDFAYSPLRLGVESCGVGGSGLESRDGPLCLKGREKGLRLEQNRFASPNGGRRGGSQRLKKISWEACTTSIPGSKCGCPQHVNLSHTDAAGRDVPML
ncbi:uncharacterized protein LOC112623857 [Theropithecus gelada]|uniref:uncharacterized protein LOC112623857 n=1 Tax=Theropithecus gelada TaxID=9565 RepID=UPI000DC1A622|nr:uncharacterized protein LOC112623857 [Theropithecus gelada]